VVIHYEVVLYQVYAPLPLPHVTTAQAFLSYLTVNVCVVLNVLLENVLEYGPGLYKSVFRNPCFRF